MLVSNLSPSKRSQKEAMKESSTAVNPEVVNLIQRTQTLPATRGHWRIHDAISHLARVEPRFVDLFTKHELPSVYVDYNKAADGGMPTVDSWSDPPFAILTQTIVSQQLSGASAKSVWHKFLACFDLQEGRFLRPEMVKKCTINVVTDELGKRKILVNEKPSGLSESKAKYVQSLTDAFLDEKQLKNINWTEITDEELIAKLIAVKGLGLWSVHMFMMFALHRPNVLPLGDLGIRRGLCRFFGFPKGHLEVKQNLKSIEALCASWTPFSSFASFYLWKHSMGNEEGENSPVKKKQTKSKKTIATVEETSVVVNIEEELVKEEKETTKGRKLKKRKMEPETEVLIVPEQVPKKRAKKEESSKETEGKPAEKKGKSEIVKPRRSTRLQAV
jgi:3-methyladenine DNA glycosylase/8-oxoguanine DNA glycosylase